MNQANRECEMAFIGSSIVGICTAVTAGLGVTVLPRNRIAGFPNLAVCKDDTPPPLPELFCGVYVREGAGQKIREQLADVIADTLNPNRAMFAGSYLETMP